MKFRDLLSISVGNLLRRKLRTFLTVLGVIIGTTSIVVMMSLGIGLKQFMVDQIASFGSLTTITVYNYSDGSDKKNPEDSFLNRDKIEKFRGMEHVSDAYPVLGYDVIMKQGLYQGNVTLTGIPVRAMKNLSLEWGALPPEKGADLQLVVGNMVPQLFFNPKSRNDGFRVFDEEKPAVDFIGKPMFTIFDTEAYYASQGTTDGTEKVKQPKKYLLKTAAVLSGGSTEWSEHSYDVLVDIDRLEPMLRKIYGKKAIPGQPTNKKGKPYRYFIYRQAKVEVDDMEYVTDVQAKLRDMGYQAESNMEWLQSSQNTSNMIQAALGGIGAVSLLVAAIGIANTMMMSIYERTKEIGVMKVLGCDMRDIRSMFLIEAGFIGFSGGVVGVALSGGLSVIVNRLLGPAMAGGLGTARISIIPPWLAAAAVFFAILIGMAAGFFPARRAMQLSPLAAIRNE